MKYRRWTLWTLALLAALLLAAPTAFALDGLELDRAAYAPGEEMVIRCLGVTAQEQDDRCWITYELPDSPASSYKEWSYLSAGNSIVTFHAPKDLGTYELRFYKASAANADNLMAGKTVRFTVTYGKTVESVTLDKAVYAPGQYIGVSCKGVTAQAVKNGAWIAVSRADAPANSYQDWKYVKEGDATLWLNAPGEPGSYEVRYYQAGSSTEENLADGLRVPFAVAAETPGDGAALYPEANDFDWSLLTFTPGERSWTGTYETTYKTLYLRQSGNQVTGEYPEWDNGRLEGEVRDGILYGYWYESPSYAPPSDAGQLICVLHEDGLGFDGWWRYGNSGSWRSWSAGALNRQIVSGWAEEEIYAADANHLLPDCLRGADLTQDITVAEFAALNVRVFEELWQTQEVPVATPYQSVAGHPLQAEIEKAYGLGLLRRIKGGELHPDNSITRQLMAATFLDLIKACTFDGWTPETDSAYFLPYTMYGHYGDESEISATARDAVYYLTAYRLIDVRQDNRFLPAGSVSREEAVVTANRILEKLKSELL